MRKMTYSQINHAKAWGFSRRSLNLNQSDNSERFNVTSANTTGQTKIGDFSG